MANMQTLAIGVISGYMIGMIVGCYLYSFKIKKYSKRIVYYQDARKM